MTDSSEAKKLLIIRILQVLEYYSDVKHPLTQEEIIKKIIRRLRHRGGKKGDRAKYRAFARYVRTRIYEQNGDGNRHRIG